MKRNFKNILIVLSLLLVFVLLPSMSGQAAGSGYASHWLAGQEPTEVITDNYKLSSNPAQVALNQFYYVYIKLVKGSKTIASKIACNGSVLYGSKDFYYVTQSSAKKAVIYKMDLSGKNKKVAAVSGLSGQLVLAGMYQHLLYCYDSAAGNIYKVNINTRKASKIYSMKAEIGIGETGYAVSGKYLYFKNYGSSPLVRISMVTGKASVRVKKGVDQIWTSGSSVYISTSNYYDTGDTFTTDKVTSTIKKLSTESSKFVKVTSVSKALVLYANTQIIFYSRFQNGPLQYYLKLRKLKKTIKLDSDDYFDAPVVKGNYCYYITYSLGKKYSSTLWKVSLKTGKTTKVKTLQGYTFRFTGNKASYLNKNGKYVYYTLK